jgi:fibro-slime domain-containing protein
MIQPPNALNSTAFRGVFVALPARGWWIRCALVGGLATAMGCGGSKSERSVDPSVGVDAGTQVDSGGLDNEAHPIEPDAGPVLDADPPGGASAMDAAMDADVSGCGDGKLQAGETCDDGNSIPGDGCSADCHSVDRDFICPAPGMACVSTVVCGDGRVAGQESCDDGNQRSSDGCDDHCALEPGFACTSPGTRCRAATCGDGIVAGDEACDDGTSPPVDGDGCSANCRLEAGYACPQPNSACRRTTCNDGVREGSEACDDGNQVVGDGCTPFCEVEPDCAAGACRSRCGDGLILPGDEEACDDGNTNDHDGCSAVCKVEAGYGCNLEQGVLPDVLTVPVTYRDFISFPAETKRHPDFEIFHGRNPTPGLVGALLGKDGKPVYTGLCDDLGQPYPASDPGTGTCPYNQQTTSAANFDQWYRDVPGVNVTKVALMTFARDASSGAYRINNPEFFPWDNDANSWVSTNRELTSAGHDFGFTTEIRYYFEYVANPQSPQVLSFTGDDDVWVFINHRLAVDIGGLHPERTRSVTLDDTTARALSLEAGKIYEIALFHAERCTDASHFNLTLDGFVSARSRCQSTCGDGIVTGDEICDDGKNDGSYDSCTPDCRRAAYCGDGKLERGRESCDDGINRTIYGANGKAGCAPGCKPSAYCGDAEVDAQAGEECDDGTNAGGYAGCNGDCRLGPRCGDHSVQADDGEDCDDGNRLSADGCSSECKTEGPA